MRRETDAEFDQGGTRAWRANQATWHQLVVLGVAPSGRVMRPVRALRRPDAALWLAGGFLVGFSPMVLMVLALVAAYGWDEYPPVSLIASLLGLLWVWICARLWWFTFRR